MKLSLANFSIQKPTRP